MHRAASLNRFLTVPAFKYNVKIWFKMILMMILDWYFPWSRGQNYQLTSTIGHSYMRSGLRLIVRSEAAIGSLRSVPFQGTDHLHSSSCVQELGTR